MLKMLPLGPRGSRHLTQPSSACRWGHGHAALVAHTAGQPRAAAAVVPTPKSQLLTYFLLPQGMLSLVQEIRLLLFIQGEQACKLQPEQRPGL